MIFVDFFGLVLDAAAMLSTSADTTAEDCNFGLVPWVAAVLLDFLDGTLAVSFDEEVNFNFVFLFDLLGVALSFFVPDFAVRDFDVLVNDAVFADAADADADVDVFVIFAFLIVLVVLLVFLIVVGFPTFAGLIVCCIGNGSALDLLLCLAALSCLCLIIYYLYKQL